MDYDDKNIESSLLNIFKKDYAMLFILYTLAHGLILLNRGVFYDDWAILYNTDKTIMLDTFRQLGLIWLGYLNSFLLSFDNSIFFYRLIVFIAFFLSALFLNEILKNIKEIDSTARLFITLFFALFPVNSARILLATTLYSTLSYFLFFLGFWLVTKYIINRNAVLRIIALLVLFISFSTKSLLVFYSLVILYILYQEKNYINSSVPFFNRMSKYADFILLPIIFWVIKSVYFVPYGAYEGYNSFKLQNLVFSLASKDLLDAFRFSFMEVVNKSFQNFSFKLLILTIILTAILLKQNSITQDKKKKYFWQLALGIFAFFVAVYPYVVVGSHPPRLDDWYSRNQLLVPLGASLILFYSIKIVFEKLNINLNGQIFVYSLLIALFIIFNFNNYLDYQGDTYKQMSLIVNIKSNEIIKNNSNFLFKDTTPYLNANGRSYRPYEYTGFMKYAFGDDHRYGSYYESFFDTKRKPEVMVIINCGDCKINVLKLKYYELYEPEKFKEITDKIVSLEIVKLDDGNLSNVLDRVKKL